MKKRRIKGIQMIPYGLLVGVMTEDSIEERQREVRLTEISSEGFRIRLCRRGKAEENIYPKAFKICFYQMDQAEYREIEIRHFQIEAGELTEFYQAYDIFTVQEEPFRSSVSNIADTFRSSWKRMMHIWRKK